MEAGVNHCYCKVSGIEEETPKLSCMRCKRHFHLDCVKTGRPSVLVGDVFFHFVCAECSSSGEEEVERMKMQWSQVVLLVLYNLQLSGTVGKYGYFRWKEHICAYIDKHWMLLFGGQRKKTSLWHGTVAGTLSSGCPLVFTSGAKELGENGWWRLTEMKPPFIKHALIQTAKQNKKRSSLSPVDTVNKVEGLRSRRGKTSIEAAMELKAKRETLTEAKDIRRARSVSSLNTSGSDKNIYESSLSQPCPTSSGSQDNLVTFVPYIKQEPVDQSFSWNQATSVPLNQSLSSIGSSSTVNSSFCSVKSEPDEDSQFSHASSSKADSWLTENELKPQSNIPSLLMSADLSDTNDSGSDLEIDPGTITPPPGSPQECHSPMLHDILSSVSDNAVDNTVYQSMEVDSGEKIQDTYISKGKGLPMETNQDVKTVKEEVDSVVDSESESENSSCDESESTVQCERGKSSEKTKIDKDVKTTKQETTEEEKCVLMSVYEERQLLKKLNDAANTTQLPPETNRLRRKLIIRQLKRERGLPIFDIDVEMNKMARKCWGDSWIKEQEVNNLNPHGLPISRYLQGDVRILDRFQTSGFNSARLSHHKPSFLNRLVGTEDDQLQCIVSPYTARILKPFIRRDYETKSKKMNLLEEIKAYPHRKDPTWVAPLSPPIDYCYVRPQHIPSVNTLCREFFWPGIDLSECLQYPDFSVIALFRKVVIGFAFMVPDVSYNEAYISFIFTHPEWRGAGIAKFMLYHLIQTCMGKDVCLHVSATNTAMILYQKFGFKPEEFMLDFYDKYYPEDSKECRHAFHLRLRR